MKKHTVITYDFDELSDDAKETAIDTYRDINVDYDGWSENTLDYHKEELKRLGFYQPEIGFTGFWNQGDGASFTCKEIDLPLLMEKLGITSQYKLVYDLLLTGDLSVNAGLRQMNTSYLHSLTVVFKLEMEELYQNDMTDDEYYPYQSTINKQIEELRDYLENWRYDICQDIYISLRNDYEDCTSDDSIAETLRINEYEFTDDGKMY